MTTTRALIAATATNCIFCNTDYPTNDALVAHVASLHPHSCYTCVRHYDNQSQFHEHVMMAHPSMCLRCDVIYHSEQQMNTHLATAHKITAARSSSDDGDNTAVSDQDILKLVVTVNDLIKQRAKRRREWNEISAEYKRKLRKADAQLERVAEVLSSNSV